MITPNLERLLINGNAKYKTFMSHLTAVAVLPVPAGQTVIITDVMIYPFTQMINLEPPPQDLTDPAFLDCSSTNYIDFFSGSDRNGFLFRSNVTAKHSEDEIPEILIKNSEPIHFDCYFKHKADIYISIVAKIAIVNGITAGDFNTLIGTQAPPPPLSYGRNINVLRSNQDFNNFFYAPTTQKQAGINQSDSANQPYTVVQGGKPAIQDPYTLLRNYLTPMYNIGYVLVNSRDLRATVKTTYKKRKVKKKAKSKKKIKKKLVKKKRK